MPTAVSNIRSSGGKVSVGGVGGFLRRLKRRSTKKKTRQKQSGCRCGIRRSRLWGSDRLLSFSQSEVVSACESSLRACKMPTAVSNIRSSGGQVSVVEVGRVSCRSKLR